MLKKFALLSTFAIFTTSLSPLHTSAATLPDEAKLHEMTARFAKVPLKVDISHLSKGDRQAVIKLLQATQAVNPLYMKQLWSGNLDLRAQLQKDSSPLGLARYEYFWMNKGPWSWLDENSAFIPGVPAKLPDGANFYPEDMTKQEFETWVKALSPADQTRATGFFTVIRRDANHKLTIVPYNQEYKTELESLSALLKQAAALTDNKSLRRFLNTRADAFLSNDYYASDVAWMDVDAPVDVTIGPYEVYADAFFNYKAAFESYINITDAKETAKVKFFGAQMQDMENNLPIEPKYRNPKIGALSPIRVVNQLLSAGDADHGVKNAAYNLPNDEKVTAEKGSKRVMLKNIQEAKFNNILKPIAEVVLTAKDRKDINFDWFFTHILAHEMTHGIGPHQIKIDGRDTTARNELKELHGLIEEAKADITGLYFLQHLLDHGKAGKLPKGPKAEREIYTTFLTSSFRTLRFGMEEAHAKGMAIQLNYILDKGGFKAQPDGTFSVNLPLVKTAVRDLDHELLTIEATGNYAVAKDLQQRLGIIRPEVQRALDRLKALPIDIDPLPVTADELLHEETDVKTAGR